MSDPGSGADNVLTPAQEQVFILLRRLRRLMDERAIPIALGGLVELARENGISDLGGRSGSEGEFRVMALANEVFSLRQLGSGAQLVFDVVFSGDFNELERGHVPGNGDKNNESVPEGNAEEDGADDSIPARCPGRINGNGDDTSSLPNVQPTQVDSNEPSRSSPSPLVRLNGHHPLESVRLVTGSDDHRDCGQLGESVPREKGEPLSAGKGERLSDQIVTEIGQLKAAAELGELRAEEAAMRTRIAGLRAERTEIEAAHGQWRKAVELTKAELVEVEAELTRQRRQMTLLATLLAAAETEVGKCYTGCRELAAQIKALS